MIISREDLFSYSKLLYADSFISSDNVTLESEKSFKNLIASLFVMFKLTLVTVVDSLSSIYNNDPKSLITVLFFIGISSLL